MDELFAGVLERGGVREATGDVAWVQAMLDAEAALARALAAAGVIGGEDAEAIASACRAERFDAAQLGADAAAGEGNPVPALVRALTAAVPEPAARHVHLGATSQDILDTAAVLVARRAALELAGDLRTAADAAADLAREHRDTVMAGRTLGQQAVPTTFGLKAAVWMTALDASRVRIDETRRALPAQLGGAAGTLASLGDRGPAVLSAFARELDLPEPTVPWHTDRTPVAALAGALGAASGAVAKAAGDVVLLAQTEVAEARERGPGGGSSTMPHKRNPVAAVAARACAAQAPGLVATLLGAMAHEHERAAGAWQAEWRPFVALLRSTGSAAAWLAASLGALEVDAARMRANLDATGGRMLAERVTAALASELGRGAAHDAIAEAARSGEPFADALLAHPALRGHLDRGRVEELLDPAGYLGSARAFVDRALEERAGG